MMTNDVYEEAFQWVMLGRPATVEGLRYAMPTLAVMGIGPARRRDWIVLPDGTEVDVIRAADTVSVTRPESALNS